MKVSKLIVIIIGLFTATIFGQQKPFYKDYNWQEKPISNIDLAKFTDKDVVAFKDKTVNEFFFEDENSLVEYSLVHKLYWLNSNDKIEEYNKVYLPYAAGSEIVKNKARVITADGKIQELDDSKILTAQDDETQRTYKYYALEGVEKGSFIEYYHVVKRYPNYTGNRIKLQSDIDKQNVAFDLFTPTNLIFDSKSYNGLPDMVLDTINKEKNHWKLRIDELSGLEKEAEAPYSAMTKYLIYKLKSNTSNPTKDLVAYNLVAQNIYNSIYAKDDKKVEAQVDKFIASIKEAKTDDVTQKIRAIENYIKTNVYVAEVKRDDLEDLGSIIENKVASETGVVRLYGAILQDYLIYFPKIKLYMAPTKLESRLGYPPGYFTDNYGLFIKQVTLGGFTSGVGSVKYIKPVNYDKTNYNLVMKVNFDPDDLTITNLNMDRTMDGYYSVNLQPYLDIAKQEARDQVTEGIIKSINENIEIVKKKMLNGSSKDFGNKPLQVIADLTSEEFVEKAGNKYLFKIGALIGPQQEMYQEKARVLPVENEFERSYDRKVIVDIPEGYQFKNLENINMDESYKKDDIEQFMFKSSYSIKDNQLIISIREYYNQNIIELPIYEEYRTVINSAANFNKVTLVLEKK